MKISEQGEKDKKTSVFKNVGIFSVSLLATASAVYIYSPVIGSHADSSATADINLAVGEVMNLTLDTNALNLSTNPNNFVSGTINATVSTNSQYGYTLTLEDVDNISNLAHTNENIDSALTSDYLGSKTSSEMEDNTWGYALNDTDFFKVPINGSPAALKRTNTPMTAASETTAVTFGAKVGNLTSGTYTDKVLFTVYTNGQSGNPKANPPVFPSEPGEDPEPRMQSFSCTLLENVGDSMVIEDVRDGNQYGVKKLKDGNCWMTDNLKIAGQTLDSYTSDLPDGVTYNLPSSIAINTPGTFWNQDNNDVYVETYYGFGGYYSFYGATAGWGTVNVHDEYSPQSICPKGWRLPTSDEYLTLAEHYHSADLLLGEPKFMLGGEIAGGTLMVYDSGNGPYGPAYTYYGWYWSSKSLTNGTNAAFFNIDSHFNENTNLYSFIGDSGKYPGFNVRCISRR